MKFRERSFTISHRLSSNVAIIIIDTLIIEFHRKKTNITTEANDEISLKLCRKKTAKTNTDLVVPLPISVNP